VIKMQKARPFWLLETRDFIAIILVMAMVGLMFALVLRPTTIPDTPVTNIVIGGFMTVGFSAVIQFYFGSSKGSVAKDDTINAIAAGASPPIVEQTATSISAPATVTQAAPAPAPVRPAATGGILGPRA
jgi:hypothetical protein